MITLDVPVVYVAFSFFCLVDRVFRNPLVVYGLYMLIKVCMVIF